MSVKLNGLKSYIDNRCVMVTAVFVMLLGLIGRGDVHAEPYEEVMKEVRSMQNRINSLEQLVLSQQEEINRLRYEQNESVSVQAGSTNALQSTISDRTAYSMRNPI